MSTAAPKTERRTTPRELILPFWTSSNERWLAALMLSALIATGFGGVYLSVWANTLLGSFTDALISRQWASISKLFMLSVLAAVLSTGLTYSRASVQQILTLRWRTWMTRQFITRWMAGNAFYSIERDQLLSNADQRIGEDINNLTELVLGSFLALINVVASCLSFSFILWQLSGSLSLDQWGIPITIPGYMLIACILFALSSLWLSHRVGKPLITLTHRSATVEADFRFLASQIREGSEQIAFLKGGQIESERLWDRFENILRVRTTVIWRHFKLGTSQALYRNFIDPVPTLLALPRYLAGAISFGDMTRVTGAYNQVAGSLDYFSQAYATFTNIAAIVKRLLELSDAILATEERQHTIELTTRSRSVVFHSEHALTLLTPQGRHLQTINGFTFKRGERWLVHGPSGAGKSTLLRALAGLWPYGSGAIQTPDGSSMFIPQRSYIPTGSLRAALSYPRPPHIFSDADYRQALADCRLELLSHQLDVIDRWQHRLSGGEQQRLGLARALLHKPDFIFLDESTSALDPATESHVYAVIMSKLPVCCVLSVAHRESVQSLHNHQIELDQSMAHAVADPQHASTQVPTAAPLPA